MNTISKIKALNSILSTVCPALMIALPLGIILFWLNFEQTLQYLDIAQSGVLQLETIQPWQIISAAVFSTMVCSVLLVGLWNLRLIFNSFKQGQFFTEQNIRSFHTLSKVLFASAVIQCLTSSILSVLLTWNNEPGEKALIISLGSNEFWLVFIAITCLAITWSFKEGQKLAEENAEFI